MVDTSRSGTRAVSDGAFTVTVVGADMFVKTLRAFEPQAARELRNKLRQVGAKVRSEASAYGFMGHSPTGAYAGSFSVRNLAKGVKVQSSDPGAGAIEFANKGAVYLRGPRYGRPIGTPAVAKPKALIRAANENEPEVVETVRQALQRAADQVRGA